jgi:hypothetical protein
VKELAIVYFSTIDKDIKVSQAGASVTKDTISYCEAIVDVAMVASLSSVVAFIDDMQRIIQQTRRDAEDMLEGFRRVRQQAYNVHFL